MLRAVRWKCQ